MTQFVKSFYSHLFFHWLQVFIHPLFMGLTNIYCVTTMHQDQTLCRVCSDFSVFFNWTCGNIYMLPSFCYTEYVPFAYQLSRRTTWEDFHTIQYRLRRTSLWGHVQAKPGVKRDERTEAPYFPHPANRCTQWMKEPRKSPCHYVDFSSDKASMKITLSMCVRVHVCVRVCVCPGAHTHVWKSMGMRGWQKWNYGGNQNTKESGRPG